MKQSVKFWIFFCTLIVILPISASEEYEATAILKRAVQKHKSHRIEEAIDDYNRALSLEPEWPEIYYNRGLAKNEIDDYYGAIEDFTRAINLDPENDSAYFNRGIAKYESKQYQAALKDFDMAIEMLPGDAKSYLNRAMTKYALGDEKGALKDAEQAKKFFKVLNKKNEYLETLDFINSIKNYE